MRSFIHKSIIDQINKRVLDILDNNNEKRLFFKEKVSAGYRFHVIGVNDFGHVFMPNEISISWDLNNGQKQIKILNQIKNNEYYCK